MDSHRSHLRPQQELPAQQPQTKWAIVVLILIIALEAVMLALTRGDLTRPLQMVLFAGIALVTGTLFWVLTPGSQGTVTLKALGIRLGGGAGIGACFIILAWWLTDVRDRRVLVPVPLDVPKEFVVQNRSPDAIADIGELRTQGGKHSLYVEFMPTADRGQISLRFPGLSSSQFVTQEYAVTLTGGIKRVNPPSQKSKLGAAP